MIFLLQKSVVRKIGLAKFRDYKNTLAELCSKNWKPKTLPQPQFLKSVYTQKAIESVSQKAGKVKEFALTKEGERNSKINLN